ncbi:phage tail tape measure protein [Fictibacillus sp. 7GRE50]|uniref:phage tail tape measure protein n=1 Tax=Fictibacillus sp. 7GRE50 TaxID=2745878 RepID=UPI0018CD27A0|nr:phage tail tape measure protein [Fictibacillus sp. 7GRE50]MBH0166280.1 phage tail tape measure protein [Fictibacillus sp. 7GRE50]
MADKAKNVVLNFKMDGQVQYAQTLKQINAVMNTAAKEYKNHIAAMGQDASATDKLRAEKKKLEIQMDGAQKRTKMLRDEYEAMSKDTSTTTDQLTKMYGKLLDAESAEIKLQQSMEKVSKGLSDQATEARDAQNSLDKLKSESQLLEAEQKSLTSAFKLQNAELGENASESERLELSQKQFRTQMELSVKTVNNLEKQLESTKKVYGENSVEVLQLEKRINDTKSSVLDFKKSLDKLEDSGEKTERSVGGMGDKFSEVGGAIAGATGPAGEFIGSLASAPWAAVAAGVAAVGAAAVTAAIDFENADAKIQASLGVTKERAKELGEVTEEVWKNGWGESIDDVARSVIAVNRNLRDLPKEEIQKAAEYAQILADTFEVDVADSTRTVKQLMATFGMTAEQSFDFITKGFQEGLDFSGEFLDSINEYSPQFKSLGMDATDMFTLFKQGAENGAFNLDKLGDIVKEFNIRVKDGSKATSESFAGMSKETQNLWKQFNEGKVTGEVVFNAIVRELSNMDDKVKANQLAVGVFGTQWEDLEAEVVGAIDTSVDKLGEFEGATKKAGDALSDTTAAKVKEKNREIIASFEEIASKVAYFLYVMEEKEPEIAETFNLFGENISAGTKKAVGAFLELNDNATTQIALLKSSVVPLSQETASEVTQTFETMATQVRDAIAARQGETLTNMQTFFATSSALTAEEEANALAKLNSNYETRTQVVTDGQNRIVEILNTAKEEKRSITDAEATEINAIQARMQTQAIDMMTASEAEQKSILERLKAEASKITAQQAADVVKNSLKQKNESVKAAEDQYDKTVQEIIRQRDETKSITAEQAEALIRSAREQKDKSVAEAEIMHRDVVKEAKAQAKEHVGEIDWATGQMIGFWEGLWGDTKEIWGNIYDTITGVIDDILSFIDGIEFKLPKFELPEMPHFSLDYETKSFMGKDITYPTGFDVDWRAKGAIFTQPTIFGMMNGRLQGAGDAGPEAALPLNEETLGAIGRGIASTMDLKSGITQHISITSPDPTSPSENARKFKQAQQQLALEWR